jgi:membrane-bound ClpP family serine protease
VGAWALACALAVLAVLGSCGGPLRRVDLAAGQQGAQTVAPSTLVVTLSGKLGTVELARCHRTLRLTDAPDGAKRVVFRLRDAGSQGEDVSDVQSLLDHVQNVSGGIETVAVLEGQVTQGAAALALVCRKVFCLPNASWGEVTKPEGELGELLSAAPDAAIAERLDAARDAMATRLARRGDKLRPDAAKLALAMADPRMQLVVATVRQNGIERQQVLEQSELAALTAGGAKVLGDRPLTRPLRVTAQEAEELGLSNGTLQSLDQLADVLLIDRATIGELEDSWAEHMVAWLELLQPFLLVAGFLLLLVEIKTPGVGLPGVLGVAFLALALFYSYLVGLAEVTEILVFFLGIAAIAVEIFLLPGTIVFGAVGFLCLVLALVLSRQSFVLPANAIEEGILLANLLNLTLLFVAVLVLGGLLWRLLPRVPWFNRVFLPPPSPGAMSPATGGGKSGYGLADAALTALVGRTGRAATVLRPTGAMELDGQRVDVVTEGEFVPAGTAIRVLYVQGPRVVVAADGADSTRAGERGEVGVGLVLLLCVVGLALIAAEVLFVSFGVIAVLAGVALLSAIFVAFQSSVAFGVTMVVVEAIAAPIVMALSFRLLPKTPFGKALILQAPVKPQTAVAEEELRPLVGKTGVALSPLRPAGIARVDGRRVDVVTRGEMLDAEVPIVVLEVTGNRVVVAAARH